MRPRGLSACAKAVGTAIPPLLTRVPKIAQVRISYLARRIPFNCGATSCAPRAFKLVFAIINEVVCLLASGDPHDAEGIADHVGGALLTFWSGWHQRRSFLR